MPAWGAWLQLGDSQVYDGAVYVPVIFDPAGDAVASLQFDVHHDGGRLAFAHAAPGPAAISAGKDVLPGARPDRLTIIVAGLNRNALPPGVVAELYFEILPEGEGDARIALDGVVMSDAAGSAVAQARPAREGSRASTRTGGADPDESTPSTDDAAHAPEAGDPAETAVPPPVAGRADANGLPGDPSADAPEADGATTVLGGTAPGRDHLSGTAQDGTGGPSGRTMPRTDAASRPGAAPATAGAPARDSDWRHPGELGDDVREPAPRNEGTGAARPMTATGEPMPDREQLAALRAAAERPVPVVSHDDAAAAANRTPLGAILLVLLMLGAAGTTLYRRVGNRNAPGRTIRG